MRVSVRVWGRRGNNDRGAKMSIRYGYALAAMLALSVLPHPSEPERQLHSSHRSCLHDGAENRGVKMNLSASDTTQKTDRQRSEPRIAVRPVPPPTDGQTGLLAFEAARARNIVLLPTPSPDLPDETLSRTPASLHRTARPAKEPAQSSCRAGRGRRSERSRADLSGSCSPP